jgi:hypothetical protein
VIDTVHRKPIKVETNWGVEPYIDVPLEQLNEVRALLDANQVSYWVDEEVLSIDGGPEIALVTLDEHTDAAMVQRLLDGVP